MQEPAVALLARALDAAVEPPDDAISERVLDAALELAAASGIRNLTMDDVARRAGVGRMTVYRRFGDKTRLVEALAVREGRRCLAELDAAARPDQPIADQVAEGFVTSVRLAREHPLLSRLARIEPESVLRALTADGGAMFALARAFLAERLRAAQKAGTLDRKVAVDEAAELLVRLSFSFALIEDSVLPLEDPDRARDVARRLIAPILGKPPG
jgi:TetR/AcrR family transcriptional regulator, repressor for uid operon